MSWDDTGKLLNEFMSKFPDKVIYQFSDGFAMPQSLVWLYEKWNLDLSQHGKIICKFKVYRK